MLQASCKLLNLVVLRARCKLLKPVMMQARSKLLKLVKFRAKCKIAEPRHVACKVKTSEPRHVPCKVKTSGPCHLHARRKLLRSAMLQVKCKPSAGGRARFCRTRRPVFRSPSRCLQSRKPRHSILPKVCASACACKLRTSAWRQRRLPATFRADKPSPDQHRPPASTVIRSAGAPVRPAPSSGRRLRPVRGSRSASTVIQLAPPVSQRSRLASTAIRSALAIL